MTALKRRDKPTPTLDSRIAQFLKDGADTADSGKVAALIREIEAAIAEAQQAAHAAAEAALDPLNVDAVKSRTKAEQIRFEHERLTRAIPLLEAALHRAQAREYAAVWNTEYEEVEAERDELAAELTELYLPFVARLVDLQNRIQKIDREVNRINLNAPSGERRRLLGVELKARKLDAFTADQPPLADKLRLPDPGLTSVLAFPREDVGLGLLMSSAAAALATKQAGLHSPDWHAERERQLAQEQREADKRQAEIDREEREKKRAYEQSLIENDRARRTGRRRQEA